MRIPFDGNEFLDEGHIMGEQVCFAKKRQCDDSFDFFRPDDMYLVMRLAIDLSGNPVF
jgi:hypothetical protein